MSLAASTTSVIAMTISVSAFPTHTFLLKSSYVPAHSSYKASMLEALPKSGHPWPSVQTP